MTCYYRLNKGKTLVKEYANNNFLLLQEQIKFHNKRKIVGVKKAHHNFLIVTESFGFAEIALSLAITLITFPSTTGTT
jgi:hypothetical protein